VSSEDELRYLGWTELDEGFRIVEWPDRAPGIATQADLRLELAYEDPGRLATITALSPEGERITARLDAAAITEPVD
jgi:tRNA threonylcarbamoyladenosine biosynthesis protein TsaE